MFTFIILTLFIPLIVGGMMFNMFLHKHNSLHRELKIADKAPVNRLHEVIFL